MTSTSSSSSSSLSSAPQQPTITVSPSSGAFAAFLSQHNISIVVASPSSNMLLVLGSITTPSKKVLSWSMCALEQPRALLVSHNVRDGLQGLWVAAGGKSDVIHRFSPVLDRRFNETPEATFSDTYVLRQSFFPGLHDIRALYDVEVDNRGEIAFLSARYNSLCTLDRNNPSATTNVRWHPPFISTPLKAENRCNVSGVAFRGGAVVDFATSTSESDAVGAWKEHVAEGGVVLDENEVVVRGLSLPCAPRRVNGGARYILNSGTGELGRVEVRYVDEVTRFVPFVSFPGFVQDMVFVTQRYVLVVSSAIVPPGVELHERLAARKASAQCAIFLVDLTTESIVEHVTIAGTLVRELTSIAVVHGSLVRVLNDGSGDSMNTVTNLSVTVEKKETVGDKVIDEVNDKVNDEDEEKSQ